MDRACGTHEGGEKRIQSSGGKTWRKETTWNTRCNWVDNIKIYLKEIWLKGVVWVCLSEGRGLLNIVINLRIPWSPGSILSSVATVSFSRRELLDGARYVHMCAPFQGKIISDRGFLMSAIRTTCINWTHTLRHLICPSVRPPTCFSPTAALMLSLDMRGVRKRSTSRKQAPYFHK